MEASAKILDARKQFNQGRRGKVVSELVDIIRKFELSYEEFNECGAAAREQMQLIRKKRAPKIKPIPSLDDVRQFIGVIDRQSPADSLMIKILLFLGIRSCELVKIKISDLDLTPGQERINVHRKAGLDRWFIVPEKLTSLLRLYISQAEKQVYLFEPRYHEMYSREAIRKKIQKYRKEAGLGDIIHAHNFRHMLLTLLAAEGWSDSELQLISGHSSRTSLDKYTHLNPELIRKKANQALNNVMVGV